MLWTGSVRQDVKAVPVCSQQSQYLIEKCVLLIQILTIIKKKIADV